MSGPKHQPILTPLVYIETYGCQMNENDSELIITILKNSGLPLTTHEPDATVILLNTCTVRKSAENKVFNRIHILKQKRKNRIVGIVGCMASSWKQELIENPAYKIDFIAGPDSYKQIPSLINTALQHKKSHHITFQENELYSDICPTRQNKTNAWITIMRGCNNFCSFCVVPFTRGRERSRAPESIISEAKRAIGEGISQITLLGQNVNSYTYENWTFTALIKELSQLKGVKRLRFTSPHPKDLPLDLIQLMAKTSSICNQIHLPLQAGSNRILKRMNRPYTREHFLDLVNTIRQIIPDINITTDIIIGFPGETDADFEETAQLVNDVEFNSAFIFKYSERPYTLASKQFKDTVSGDEKTKRIVALNALQKSISLKKNKHHIGSTYPVLIEQLCSKKDATLCQGKTEGNITVIFPRKKHSIGDIIPIKITQASAHTLKGETITV